MASELRLSGLGTGADMDGIIKKLMEIERRPVVALQKRQLELEAKRDLWRDINTRLSGLKSKITDLKLPSTFNAKKASSGDDKIITATATSDAIASTYSIKVEDLAQAHSVRSATQASATAALGLAAGNITVGKKTDGTAAVIDISANDSLNSVAEKINKNSSTVTASVITVATNDVRLVLTSKSTGASYNMGRPTVPGTNTGDVIDGTSNALTALGFFGNADGDGDDFNSTSAAAKDSKVRIDGLLVQRSGNTITDAITGLTLNLKAKSASDGAGGFLPTSVTVSADSSAATNAISAFVEQYNAVQGFISDKMAKDPTTGRAGLLQGDPTASLILNTIRRMVTGKVAGMTGKKYDSLTQIGITSGAWNSADKDKLKFDSAKFTAAMNSDPAVVAELFGAQTVNVALTSNGTTAAASSTAVGYNAADLLNGLTSSDAWGAAGGGWQDDTADVFPDTVTLTFSENKTIDKIKLYTLNSATQPSTSYGVKSFDIQYWDGGAWNTLKSVTDNTVGYYTAEFEAVTTNQIQIVINDVNGNSPKYSRLIEIEAYQKNYGAASQLDDYLNTLTKSSGTVTSTRNLLEKQVQNTKDRISKMETRLEDKEDRLIKQFAKLETALGKINRQGAWLQAQLGSLR